MRTLISAAAAAALGAGGSTASAATKHRPDVGDLAALQNVSYMKLSPDATTLVYVVGEDMWLLETKDASAPRKLAPGLYPVWSPDSRRLAYLRRTSADLQLWVIDITKRLPPLRLTAVEGGLDPNPWSAHLPNFSPINHDWSPDGKRIVFSSQLAAASAHARTKATAEDPMRKSEGMPLVLDNGTPPEWTLSGIFAHDDTVPEWSINAGTGRAGTAPSRPPLKDSHLFIVEVDTGRLLQLTRDQGQYFEPDWGPDAQTIVCSSTDGHRLVAGSAHPVNLYRIDVTSGGKHALTRGSGDRWLPRWSPDGRWVAFIDGEPNGKHSVYVVSKEGSHLRSVTSLSDHFVYGFEWAQRSDRVAVNYIDGISLAVSWFDIHTGVASRISAPEASALYLTAASSGAVAWQQTTGSQDGVLTIVRASGPPRTLVELNPQIATWELGAQEAVRWTGVRREPRAGVLIKPVGYRKAQRYPLIVDVYPQQMNSFKGYAMAGNQTWAAAGYAVFFANPRPPHFFRALSSTQDQFAARGAQGWDTALADVLTGIDKLVEDGIVDSRRVALYGFSNGGGVVNYLVTRTDRFRCAVSVAAALPDWPMATLLQTDSTAASFAGGVTLWDDPFEYVRLSSVYRLDRVKTPMLLAVGDHDHHSFILGAVSTYNGLRAHGGKVTLLRYPGQGHGFSGAALRDFSQRQMKFFAECFGSGN